MMLNMLNLSYNNYLETKNLTAEVKPLLFSACSQFFFNSCKNFFENNFCQKLLGK